MSDLPFALRVRVLRKFCSNMAFGALVLVFSLTVFTAYADKGEAGEYKKMEFDNGNYKVTWKHDEMNDNLTFHLEVKTTGWVGFGFGKKAPNFMMDYDVMIGGINGAGVNYLYDYYTKGRVRPPRDTSQDYKLLNATESNGWTRIYFTRKADTGDMNDTKITAGEKLHLIWAYRASGEADTASFGQHSQRGFSELVEIIEPPTFTNKLTMDNGNYVAQWNYDAAKQEYDFYLKVKTTGWVAFGFATTAPNTMQGYDVAIGGVTSGGTPYLNDFYTSGRARPPVDANQDFTLVKGTENGGYTILRFKRKANTGDTGKDLVLTAGTKVFIVWAYHSSADADNTNTFPVHTSKGFSAASMDLTVAPTTQPPTTMAVNPTTMAYTNVLTMDGGNYKANWKYDAAKKEYTFHLKVKTTGWIAFGFAKKAPNTMQGYDVAIGGVTSGGTAYINDFYTSGRSRPPVDASQDFTLVNGTESGGYTQLWFKRKADTGDNGKDLPITAGTKVFIVWAYHLTADADNTNTFPVHTSKGNSAASMDLTGGVTGSGSLVKYSFVAIITNLFIAVRFLF